MSEEQQGAERSTQAWWQKGEKVQVGGERWQPQAGRKGQPSAITAAKA